MSFPQARPNPQSILVLPLMEIPAMWLNPKGYGRRATSSLLAIVVSLAAFSAAEAQQNPRPRANWALADKFSPQALTGVIGSTTLSASFINKTDSAWYNWRDRNGSRF